MDSAPIDLKKLAEDAQKEARTDIRASKWCRLMHDWTKWDFAPSRRTQIRCCIGCGKVKVRFLSSCCDHSWCTDRSGDVMEEGRKFAIGRYYDQTCKLCSEKRRKTIRT